MAEKLVLEGDRPVQTSSCWILRENAKKNATVGKATRLFDRKLADTELIRAPE